MPPISLRTCIKILAAFKTNNNNNKKGAITQSLNITTQAELQYWINPMSSCKTGNKATLFNTL